MNLDTEEVLDEKDAEEGLPYLVYEKSNKFSAAWKFLRDTNRANLEGITGGHRCFLRVALFMNFPVAYTISLIRAEYSPQNLGYRF